MNIEMFLVISMTLSLARFLASDCSLRNHLPCPALHLDYIRCHLHVQEDFETLSLCLFVMQNVFLIILPGILNQVRKLQQRDICWALDIREYL